MIAPTPVSQHHSVPAVKLGCGNVGFQNLRMKWECILQGRLPEVLRPDRTQPVLKKTVAANIRMAALTRNAIFRAMMLSILLYFIACLIPVSDLSIFRV